MSLDTFLVADYFLQRAKKENILIRYYQLERIMYLTHARHLVKLGRPLLAESFEAWDRGIALPSLYYHFEPKIHYYLDPIEDASMFDIEEAFIVESTKHMRDTGEVLDEAWQEYKNLGNPALIGLTQGKNTPYGTTYNALFNFTIDNDKIRDYYRSRI